jgi:protoporphyrinogen/coproporphyrinogen III oxidase
MPSAPQLRSVAVVGGGIAGLAAAHALLTARPDLAVTILEGGSAVGGKLRLGQVGGQTVDVGAEALLNRRPEATALARAVGLGADLVHPDTSEASIWSRGRLRPLPRTVLGVPVDVGLTARRGPLSRRGAVRARAERRLRPLRLDGDVAVGPLVARRLGPEVRDRLVEPLLGGVYAGRAEELSFEATMPQLSSALRFEKGLLSAAASVRAASQTRPGTAAAPVFAGIAGGVGRLPAAVTDDVVGRGAVVRCSAVVRAIDRTASGWRVVVGPAISPEAVLTDAVILATPAVAAARLLGSVAPLAAEELGRIEYASMAVVTLALRADVGSAGLVGSGFLVPPVDGRAIKATTYSSCKWGWLDRGSVVVRCSFGRHGEQAQLQRDDDELVSTARTELGDATGVRAPLVDATVTRWGGALPQYAVGHLERVARIEADVERVPGLELCGAAFDGVGVAAVIASAQRAATRVLGHLGQPGQ